MKMKKVASVLMSAVLLGSTGAGVLGLASCGGGSDPNTIRYIAYSGGGSLDEMYRITKKVDDYVYEKLGFHIDIEYIGYNTYANDITRYFATGEDFDMCYSGSLLSGLTFSDAVSNGYYADITEALPEHAPELYASMSETIWDAARVGGKIYGVINEQMFARSVGIAIDKEEVLPNLKVDTDNDGEGDTVITQELIDTMGITYQDLIYMAMEYIESTLDKGEEMPSTTLVIGDAWDTLLTQNYALDSLGTSSYVPGIIEATTEGTPTVFNQFESKYFKEFADFCRDMHERGWIHEKQAQTPVTANQRVRVVGTYYPNVTETTLFNSIGREFVEFRFGTPLLSTVNVTSSVTAINAESKKVDKCLKFLNLLNQDQYLYNLLAIGEEDLEYEWKTGYRDDDSEYRYISYIKTSKYKPFCDWAFGSELNTYMKRGYEDNWVQTIKDINNNALISPAYGFTFLPDYSLSDEISNCSRVVSQYINMFVNGSYNEDQTNDEIIAELNGKIGGYASKIVAEKQKQLDDFLASKN